MSRYRQFLIVILISGLLLGLTGRLFWLQSRTVAESLLSERGLAYQAVRQRRAEVLLDDGRGRIVDRTGQPLVGYPMQALLVKSALAAEDTEELLQVLDIERRQWQTFLDETRLPALWRRSGEHQPMGLTAQQAERLHRLSQHEVKVVPYLQRYLEQPLAAQLIGYIGENPELIMQQYKHQIVDQQIGYNQQIGVSGLERSFDRFLQAVDPISWGIYQDGRSQSVYGLEDRLIHSDNAFYPLTLHTTIDRELQKRIEALLSRYQIQAAGIVVLAANSGDILAMANLPVFDPNQVLPERGLWRNLTVSAYAPGSVFKTVVAAAALEAGLTHPGEQFQCDGVWHEHHLRCVNRSGHGRLTLEQAYAQSCNLTFAQLAVRVGPERLEATAAKLGMGQQVGWSRHKLQTPIGIVERFRQLDAEQPGQIFDAAANRMDQGALARTGIGQQDVRMTPLQAARLNAIIINGGYAVTPRIVSEVLTEHRQVYLTFPLEERRERLLSGRTAAWLANAMRLTAQAGTARVLSTVTGGAGGKTGTAEEGSGSERYVHQWFTGFAPAQAPKYTFTVLVPRRAPNSRHLATTIAQELVQLLGEE